MGTGRALPDFAQSLCATECNRALSALVRDHSDAVAISRMSCSALGDGGCPCQATCPQLGLHGAADATRTPVSAKDPVQCKKVQGQVNFKMRKHLLHKSSRAPSQAGQVRLGLWTRINSNLQKRIPSPLRVRREGVSGPRGACLVTRLRSLLSGFLFVFRAFWRFGVVGILRDVLRSVRVM